MKLTELCVRKPVFAWMLMTGTIVFGLVAVTRIGISQFPDVDFPTISVNVSWAGAAPEVVENDVVDPLEEALSQVEGVKSLTSSSRMGSASITVELDMSRNVDLALQDVQAKVAAAQRNLPRDIDPPTISKSNPEDQPIMMLTLAGPYPARVLSDYVKYNLSERIQSLPGVGEIVTMGGLERNVRLWLDIDRLNERDLTVDDVVSALARENVEMPAGRIETRGREVNIRVLGEAFDLETIRRIVVKEVDDRPIYVGDVCLVEDGFEDMRRFARFNDVPAQAIGVKKQRGSNAIAVAATVKNVLDELRKTLPEGMSINLVFDSTQFIEDSVNEIELELILSVLLTALVCRLFLGSFASTLNVILAIPMSLLGTIAAIYFLGYTFNTFTLLALALAVGIVVDDAIMVLENIYRHREEGEDLVTAALEGTYEIAPPALAATLAVVAIFVPVVFMKGVIGAFFLQFGVTLCVAIVLSYVEAITLAPARCSQFLVTTHDSHFAVDRWIDHGFAVLERAYGAVLHRALNRPRTILALAALLFAASLGVFYLMKAEFVPSQDLSRLAIRLQTAVGSDISETDTLVRRASAIVSARPEVSQVFYWIGGGSVNSGQMFVTLVPPGERRLDQAAISAALRRELNAVPGLRAVIQDLSQQGFTAQRGFPVQFSVRGSDWDALVARSREIMDRLASSGLVTDLDSDYRLGMPELRVEPDRAAASDLGVSLDDVGTTLNVMFGGVKVGKFSSDGRRIDMRLKLLADQRSRPEDLGRLRVKTRGGALVPLSSLVSTRQVPALQAITRMDRERAITVNANVAPGHSQDEAIRFVEGLARDLPVGERIVLGGASVAFRESMQSLLFALLLGVAIAYMILASQFNSYKDPATIITILPLSVAGAAFGLLLFGQTLNVFSMIGLLLLMGIVKKNSIILVDYANNFRREGLGARAAMEKAGPIRLRPILMTATATLMAAVPPALGLGPGAEIRMPMAIGIIGGLVVSTALSLVVVPSFYIVADRWFRRGNSSRG